MNNDFFSSKTNIRIIILMLVLFFVLKLYELNHYYIYEGKITSFETVFARYQQKRGYSYGKRTIPLFEYYKEKDTLKTGDGHRVLYSNFSVGEKIKILENTQDDNDVKIFSLFFFWIIWEEILILGLVYIIIAGYWKVFKYKKS